MDLKSILRASSSSESSKYVKKVHLPASKLSFVLDDCRFLIIGKLGSNQ